MKVYWRYCCDYGHTWTLYRDEHIVEHPADALCLYGHEAVTLQKARPVDEVQIILLHGKTMRSAWTLWDKIRP